MEEINDLVGYNNLKIYQNNDWFKFSIEAILLPHFININYDTKEILDICTGNCPIPIVLSTLTKAHITAVEIQKDIYDLAKKSIDINKLNEQIDLINDDAMNLMNKYETDTFDIITCNPPYFKNIEKSTKNLDMHKTIARHEIYIDLSKICQLSRKLLKNNGKLALIYPTERFIEVINEVQKYNLIPKRIQFIYPKKNTDSNLFMIECVKNGRQGVKFLDPIIVHEEDNSYTKYIREIFRME